MFSNKVKQDALKARKKDEREIQNNILSYLRDLVCLLAGVLLVFSLLFRMVIVSGESMENTLLDGDWLLLLSNTFYLEPKQGDIVVAGKDSFLNGEPIIKRVIATEGQTVDIDFALGIVSVDGKVLEETYTSTPTNIDEGIQFPITVEKGCVFVLGDNRNDSKDSRSPEIGQIDCREILGKAIFLLYPSGNHDYTRIGVLS